MARYWVSNSNPSFISNSSFYKCNDNVVCFVLTKSKLQVIFCKLLKDKDNLEFDFQIVGLKRNIGGVELVDNFLLFNLLCKDKNDKKKVSFSPVNYGVVYLDGA